MTVRLSAPMLAANSGGDFGCCSGCARGTQRSERPQRQERRQARAREKRAVAREIADQTALPGDITNPICPVSGEIVCDGLPSSDYCMSC
ncbi:hypothetical protein MYK68_15955 [Gordonia sp. PP30]|uniref:hypothetical protein n=1 Tax=Gordonia sp. PP30 TaxID=2935861 RepID=UPI001FFF5EE3|nr:hypothetical protein [Gordonia sp. PP30]UQE74205.1 hypothetical protein MYK68_15955 [Gordonia sp. PP30]